MRTHSSFLLGFLVLCSLLPFSCRRAEGQTPHPRLFIDQEDIETIRNKANRDDEQNYAAIAHEAVRAANGLVSREIPIYEEPGAWPHLYVCDGKGDGDDDPNDGCGGRLLFEENRPHEHLCPRCGTVYRGLPYDEAWISLYNNAVSHHIRNLGLAYLLTEDVSYASKAAQLCLQYADLYTEFPLSDVWGGESHVAARLYAQTLDESVWVFEILWGLDLIYDSGVFAESEKRHIENDLLRPVVDTLSRTNLGASNIQGWVSSAIGAIGFFLGDEDMIDRSINGSVGYEFLLENMFDLDGFSVEGSTSYHYYAVRPLLYLTRIADRNGRPLWDERIQRTLITPLHLVHPDGRFPRLNDAGENHLRNHAEIYELGNGLSSEPMFDRVLTEIYRKQGNRRTNHLALFAGNDFDDTHALDGLGDPPESLGMEIAVGAQSELRYRLLIDRAPHGGYHGHDDKLNVILYAQARELIPDFGMGGFVDKLFSGWLRRTIAHNTVLVGAYGQNSGNDVLSPLLFRSTVFPFFQVFSVEAPDRVYPGRTQVQRTVMKVQNEYVIVFDSVAETSEPIDVAWHAYGRFAPPENVRETDLLDQWKSSINGYQFLEAPWFVSEGRQETVMEIPPQQDPAQVVWRFPLSLSDDMEELTFWDGECALADHAIEGASSLRFLALPNRTVSVTKDITHPELDLSELRRLEFDYFLEEGHPETFSVVLQHLPGHDRSWWSITPLEAGVWHHAVIDLEHPERVLGGSNNRSRLQFSMSAAGEIDESFFVYVDNVRAFSGDGEENPLIIGLSAQIISTPPASQLLADGPGFRAGDRHGVLLSRIPGRNAEVLTLLEAYSSIPQRTLVSFEKGDIQVNSDNWTDRISSGGSMKSFALYRKKHDGVPDRILLLNRGSIDIGNYRIESEDSFDLDFQFIRAAEFPKSFNYRTRSPDDSFFLWAHLNGSEVFLDDVSDVVDVVRHEGESRIGPLPGGEHRIDIVPTETEVEKWDIH